MKKCVFRDVLKMVSEPESLIPSPRLFQSLGAAVAKLLSPNMTLQLFGTTSAVALFWYRQFLVGVYTCNTFLTYRGDWPCKAIYVITSILNWILYWIGSQWRSFNTGVMWLRREVLVISLVALFWTFCSGLSLEFHLEVSNSSLCVMLL